jgi:hypothetical protein
VNLQEEFRPIKEFEGMYLISNKGKVYSNKTNKILIPHVDKDGYLKVKLSGKQRFIHRLVAIEFIPNPNNLLQVNHKNGVKTDNYVDNLEWCTLQYNIDHAYKHNLGNYREKSQEKLDNINRYNKYLIICLVNKNTGVKTVFSSTIKAANFLNTNIEYISEGITKMHKIKGHTVYGFKRKDLESFANGEPLPEVLKGIPWEIRLKSEESCNDYPSEGE